MNQKKYEVGRISDRAEIYKSEKFGPEYELIVQYWDLEEIIESSLWNPFSDDCDIIEEFHTPRSLQDKIRAEDWIIWS